MVSKIPTYSLKRILIPRSFAIFFVIRDWDIFKSFNFLYFSNFIFYRYNLYGIDSSKLFSLQKFKEKIQTYS